MDHGLDFYGRAVPAPEHRTRRAEGALKAPGPPTGLLAARRVDRHRRLVGHHNVFEVGGPPAFELRAVAQVEILGEGRRAPPPRVLDCRSAPDAGGPGEVGEVATRGADRLLDQEVEVDHERLQAGEPRIALVEVAPARLDETDAGIVEDAHRPAQEIAGWDEVRVEDGEERRAGEGQPKCESSGLVSLATAAPDMGHADAFAPPVRRAAADDAGGLVIGVVEDLHLQSLAS